MSEVIEPKKNNDIATEQHMIPRTYLKKWKHNTGKQDRLWVYDKSLKYNKNNVKDSDWSLKSLLTKEIMFKEGFYDIKAGSPYMPDDAIHYIYDDILQYDISFNGRKLNTAFELNDNYFNLDKWIIRKANGDEFTEKEYASIKKYFKESRWTYLETAWARSYEDGWSRFVTLLENQVRAAYLQKENTQITNSDLVLLIKYTLIYNWRSIAGNEIFNKIYADIPLEDVLREIEIPEDERTYIEDYTAYDQFKHASLLKGFADYLMNDTGKIKTYEMAFIKELMPVFLLTDSNHTFITSDVPSFERVRKDGYKELFFIATPTMAIGYGRGDRGKFIVNELTPDEVKMYNKSVAEYGTQLVIKDPNFDVRDLFL